MTQPRSGSDDIPWLTVVLLTLATLLAFVTTTIVMIITPRLMLALGVGTYRIAWVSSAYLIASGLIVPVSGYLGERLHMKRLFLIALGVFVFGSLLSGLANDITTLLVARVVQALGGGLLMPVSNAIILRIVPPRRLGAAMAVRGISVSAGPSVGPVLGAYLTDRLGWHAVFLMNVPLGILILILIYFLIPEVESFHEPHFDYVGLILSCIMLFSVLLAISEGQQAGWTSLYIVVLFTLSFFFGLLFVIWELNTEYPLLDLRLFKNIFFTASMVTAVIATIGMYSGTYFTPLFTEESMHLTLIRTGLLLAPAGVAMGIIAFVAGNLFDRVGTLPLAVAGLTLASAMSFEMAYLSPATSFESLMWLLVWRSLGIGLALFPLTTGALYTVPRRLAGRASAINSVARMVPASMGLAYFTFVLNRQEAVHFNNIATGINVFSPASRLTVAELSHATGSRVNQALAVLWGEVQSQALARSLDDVFFLGAAFLLLAIPFSLLLGKGRMERARVREEARMAENGLKS
ncbi:MAG: DHA2 family efflux MFS transporter permease subunit [Peptococcaceae bacterium]|nr:DHA2 family efflux MFS transporter permease subunit [Peptococcaceae bacterium]